MAVIEPSCWPLVILPSQKPIDLVVLPNWSWGAAAAPSFGFGFGPTYAHRIFPVAGSSAVMPLFAEMNIVPLSSGRFLPLPLTTIGEPWMPPA